ncbi:MAG TPA: DnaJ domain-containing protein [Verrucomicrobiae bacterium]|nr:DnaJ domain-containing protein [Verrucomicrobiae bacterium]
MDTTNHYQTLGIARKASEKDIKTAFRRLARKYHPDRNSIVSDDIMKNINIAFEVLSDPDKKIEYDNSISNVIEYTNEVKTFETNHKTNNINGYQEIFEQSTFTNSDNNIDETNYNNYFNNSTNFKDTIETLKINHIENPKSQFQIIVEPSLCLAFGSCEVLAPKVFVVEKNKRINPKAIVISETGADFETILDAAKTCPTKAIIIIDRFSGERVYP